MWRCTPSFSRRTSRFCSTWPARRRRNASRWRCNMPELSQPAGWLPLVFMGLMGLAMLAYVALDGYDLGVGLLLAGFPIAHGVILGELYLPVAVMLLGLILRGVAFDFRVKARAAQKDW